MTEHTRPAFSPALTVLFAFACGAIVGNLYYAQPIIEMISPDVGLSPSMASLIVSLTQIGYVAGMLFITPLLDLFENKRLILGTLGLAFASLLLSAVTENGGLFLFVAFLTGLGAVSVQMLIPLAAHLSPEETRGRVVGNIMGGLLTGILVARPLSSAVADHFGWRAVFFAAAALMIVIGALLALTLPRHRPTNSASYGALLTSMGALWLRHPTLRQRALLQGTMFATFSLYWTAVPLELWREFHLTQTQIALFALAGVAGALAA
ncbi:MAG: MFS transporter, partial [Asticcacaulis sp.]